MIAAKVRLLNRQSTRETANVIGISSQYIGFASIIIAHAPESRHIARFWIASIACPVR
jgi:hypothetical protein